MSRHPATSGALRAAYRRARQSAWFDGIETAFCYFGGVVQEVLPDNARALVEHHDAATREVCFNERLHAFARYWGFRAGLRSLPGANEREGRARRRLP